jgi:methanogenic corrinoid protein MtbC1
VSGWDPVGFLEFSDRIFLALRVKIMPMSEIKNLDDIFLSLGINLSGQVEVSLQAGDPAILADYLRWQQTRMASQGFTHADALAMLKQAGAAIADGLSQDQSANMREFFQEAVSQLERSAPDSPLPVVPDLGDAAEEYTRLLLAHDRFSAAQLVTNLVKQGVPVKDIYTHVFQYSLYKVGRLWQTNEVTIAQEHFFTAATQMIMSQLYPYIFNSNRIGKRMVAASVDTNMHDIGIRMVADFFEMAGWDTYYLGGNTPPETIIEALDINQPHLLALSATMSQQIGMVQSTITHIRALTAFKGLKILVGGHPFNIVPNLWQKVGADGCAKSADEAVQLAHRLTLTNQNDEV